MKKEHTISNEEYQELKRHSAMLSSIAGVVGRYAHTPATTTYECVVALNARVILLNKKIHKQKNASGKLLK